METWEAIAVTIITGVMAWLFIRQEKQGNSLVSIEEKLNHILSKQDDMSRRQKELDDKLNMFLKSEVDTLKELTRQGFARNKG